MSGSADAIDIAEVNANERRRGRQPEPARGLRAAWRRLTLWPRLALGVTLGFVVLFAGFSLLGIHAVDASTNRILQERLDLTEELAGDLDGVLTHAFVELRAFHPGTASPSVQRRLLAETYQGSDGVFSGLLLLDPSGLVRVSLGHGAPPAGTRLGHEPYVSRVLASGRRTISKAFRDRRGTPVVALGVPLREHGSVDGVLVGMLDLRGAAIMKRLDAAKSLGRTGHAELVGPDGIALASTEAGAALHPGEHLAFYRKMLVASKPGVADVPVTPDHSEPGDLGHERHVMAFARLHEAPWGVALGGSESETYGPATHLRRTLMLAGGGSLAALWLLTLIGARLLVRPVRTLTRAAEEMASGNLEQTVSVSEGGEIGILGESLETMRAQLKDSLETVRRWGEELELKVADRTNELNARNRQLAAVSAIMTAANETHDLEAMLSRCLDVVLDQTSVDAAAVRLDDGQDGAPATTVSRGAWRDFPCTSCSGRGCSGIRADGAPRYLDARERQRLVPACAADVEALAILPLRGPGGVLGVLTLGRRRGDLPNPDERRILAAICDQIAVAVENAHLADELRRLEAQREVERMRSELISAVSHELRTPLGFIKSYATTLLRDDTPIAPETRKHFLEIIDEETDKLEHMLKELLDASRLQAGRLAIERRPTPLGALLERSVDKARHSLEESGHEVELRLPGEDPVVEADPLRIEQVLDNLLENAARYSDPGSPIEVSLTAPDDDAHIRVTNQGNGLATTELEQIFEPFYRGENSRARRVHGAGLGLAICRGIVHAHDGRIWADSSDGTTSFLLTIPLTAVP
jgi:signal transduction histidine kinase/HAMP domain-containing protein